MPAKKASKKAPKKAAKKAVKKAAKKIIPQGKCTWKAWLDTMPPGPWTLHVTGSCRLPPGYKVTLKPTVPPGFNPVILLLTKTVKPGLGIPEPGSVPVNFKMKTKTKYTHVTILPEGVTVKVQIVQ